MKAVTVQPRWAALIMRAKKRIENRSWGRNVRGRLAVHASLPVGAVVGTVVVTDVLSVAEARVRYPDQARYIAGPLCWVLADPIAFTTPQPARGRRGLWDWEGEGEQNKPKQRV